jgi:hypothetical protein
MLKVITFITNDYINILNDYFLATLPPDIDDVIIECVNKRGYFRHDPFSQTLEVIRTEFIINQIKSHMGQSLMMIDADVVFNKSFKEDIEQRLKDNDMIFQDNEGWYNFGVFALNCNNNNVKIFEHLYQSLICNSDRTIHDQHLINNIIKSSTISTNSLPLIYFGGHFKCCKYPTFPKEECYLYHATNTYSLKEKIQVLNDVKSRFSHSS